MECPIVPRRDFTRSGSQPRGRSGRLLRNRRHPKRRVAGKKKNNKINNHCNNNENKTVGRYPPFETPRRVGLLARTHDTRYDVRIQHDRVKIIGTLSRTVVVHTNRQSSGGRDYRVFTLVDKRAGNTPVV